MFNFVRRTRLSVLHGIGTRIGRQTSSASQSSKLFSYMFSDEPSSIFRVSNTVSLRCITTGSNQDSFTVSYLINKLGFSPESALKASKYLHFQSPDNPDTVISFLEKQGFSISQIKTMVRKQPALLGSDVEKTFLPKLEYFRSKGFSRPDLAKFVSHYPTVLLSSLERRIIPFFNTYSNLLHSDEKTVTALKRYALLFAYDTYIIDGKLLVNINILRDHGVPESNIIYQLYQHPSALLINPGSFEEIVEKLEVMGMDPLMVKFVHAVGVLARMNKSVQQNKVDAFKKWGWSEKEIWGCFRKYPSCFSVSAENIMAKMDFLVNKMGVDASRFVNQPSILTRSFQKKIVPRCLFAQHLLSKGLIKDFNLSTLLDASEEKFLKRFVLRHIAEAPELLELYKELKM